MLRESRFTGGGGAFDVECAVRFGVEQEFLKFDDDGGVFGYHRPEGAQTGEPSFKLADFLVKKLDDPVGHGRVQ